MKAFPHTVTIKESDFVRAVNESGHEYSPSHKYIDWVQKHVESGYEVVANAKAMVGDRICVLNGFTLYPEVGDTVIFTPEGTTEALQGEIIEWQGLSHEMIALVSGLSQNTVHHVHILDFRGFTDKTTGDYYKVGGVTNLSSEYCHGKANSED